jgi:tRNA threonylcarbamoyladenosine biosynthesis protein TsaE
MQNAERGMRNEKRPAGKTGRPSLRAFTTTFFLYCVSYFGSLIAAEGFIAAVLVNTRILANGDLLFLEPLTWLVFVALWYLIALSGVNRNWRGWDRTRRIFCTASTYILVVAILNGWIVGTAIIAANAFLPSVAGDVIQALALIVGPFIGMIWLVRRAFRMPDYESKHYDDDLQRAENRSQFELESLAATESFGRRLGSLLFPNAVVALIGPLGAGKTHLARAIAEGLGTKNPTAVTSPTFTLIHEYPAQLPIVHFDAYRLNSAEEFLDLGATEYYQAGGVCLIEWADRVLSALPEERLTITITPIDENRRRVEIAAIGEPHRELLAKYTSRGA